MKYRYSLYGCISGLTGSLIDSMVDDSDIFPTGMSRYDLPDDLHAVIRAFVVDNQEFDILKALTQRR